MDLRQLACFVAVAEQQHFGRAASSVGLGQPALSQQVRRLEKSMRVSLFERSSRHVSLTAAGEAFLPLARDVLAAAARADAFRMPSGTQLRIAPCDGLGLALADAVGHARHRREDLAIELVDASEVERGPLVRQGFLDAALVRRPTGEHDDLVRTPVGTEQLWALVPEGTTSQRRRPVVSPDTLGPLRERRLSDDADAGSPSPGDAHTCSVGELMAAWRGGEQSWTPLHPLHAAHVARMRLPGAVVARVEPTQSGTLTLLTREAPAGAVAALVGRLSDALSQAGG